jgi:pyruvate/2-oxoglutarate dehydrogenase complex dihydrolipoamide acyltransferase (E2) component
MKAQTARDRGITSKDAGKDAGRDGRITGKDVERDAGRDGESTITYSRVREFFHSQEFSHTPTYTHI